MSTVNAEFEVAFCRRPKASRRHQLWLAIVAILALAMVSLAPSPAQAQGGLDIRVDSAGTCPANHEKLLAEKGVKDILASQYQISRKTAPLYRGSNLFEPLGGEPLKFGEKVVVYIRGSGQPAPIFVFVTNTRTCGWLRDDAVFTVRNPLLLIEIPGYKDRIDAADTGRKRSKLLAKVVAMGVNADGQLFQVPVYSSPFDPAATNKEEEDKLRVGTVNHFAILNVYGHRNGKNGKDCLNVSDAECFILVGGLSRATETGASIAQVHGWLQGKNVVLWPSALSVYYREGNSDIKIYRDESAAQAVIQGKVYLLTDKQVVGYQAERHTEPPDQNYPRLPVVNGKLSRGQQIFEVVFAGGTCAIDDAVCLATALGRPHKTTEGEQVALQTGKTGKDVYGVNGIDVLLVIDGSESMDKYYQHVIEAVVAAAKDATAHNQRIRFAAVTYLDYKGEVADKFNLQFQWVARFAPEGKTDLIQNLSRGRIPERDPHSDPPEAPFAAIVRAVEEAAWHPDNRFRLVVWIADAGNRSLGKHLTPGGEVKSVVENFSEEDVANALGKKGVRGAFAAVQVRGANNAEQLARFELNANKIRQLLGTDRRGALPVKLAATAEATPSEIVASIRDHLREVLKASATAVDTIINPGRKLETKVGDLRPHVLLAKAVLEDLGHNEEAVRKRTGEVQAIMPGYVVQNEAKPDFAYWLALTAPDFTNLHRSTKEFCDALGGKDMDKGDIERTMTAVVSAVTYEDPAPGVPLSEHFKRLLGVPKASLSDIMRHESAEKFALWYVNASHDTQSRYRCEVCRRQKMLELMESGWRVRLSDIECREDRPTIARGGAKRQRFHWDWSTGTGLKYFFVPLEVLP